MHLGAGHTYATAVCPSPCLRIALVEMDPVPPSVLHLPPPLPREQVQAAAATFHCQRAPRLHRTEQHQPTHLSPTLPFLCCRTDWDRAAWLIQACSHPVLLHLLPAPCSHPSCSGKRPILYLADPGLLPPQLQRRKRPILYLTTATMKSSGPMTRTWLAAAPLSRGEAGVDRKDWESLISWRRELASDLLQRGGRERGKQAVSLGSWTCPGVSHSWGWGSPGAARGQGAGLVHPKEGRKG